MFLSNNWIGEAKTTQESTNDVVEKALIINIEKRTKHDKLEHGDQRTADYYCPNSLLQVAS